MSFKQNTEGPTRLRDAKTEATALSKLVQSLPDESELGEFQLARIHRNLLAETRASRRRGLFGLRLTATATILIVGASVGVAAAMVSIKWIGPLIQAGVPKSAPTMNAQHRFHVLGQSQIPAVVAPVEVAPPTPAEAPPAVAEQVQAETPPHPAAPVVPSRPMVAPSAKLPGFVIAHEPDVTGRELALARRIGDFALSRSTSNGIEASGLSPAARSTTPVEEEASIVSGALRLLRSGNRPEAVGQFRQYLQRFPKGAFAEEAQVALISALVESGANDEAQLALDHVTGAAFASPAMRLLRAELGFASHCAAPLKLFEEVLSTAKVPSFRERALYGAAVSNARCGDRDKAKTLMQQFQTEFPHSSRLQNIREHLDAVSKSSRNL